ncbi:putative GTP-binding protein 6 [Argiope bruennichi]|uniref:putative GTP-binding protein 6 n=1 Tax=Argiope bruennichi TaxID=94029 RepID=UPI0024940BA3|nr:putative GTP-binding protein 6 [Argiope bruennichi]
MLGEKIYKLSLLLSIGKRIRVSDFNSHTKNRFFNSYPIYSTVFKRSNYCGKFSNLKHEQEYKLLKLFNRCISQRSTILQFCDKSENNVNNDHILDDSDFKSISKSLYQHPGTGHKVLIVQPREKYGYNSEKKLKSELKLEEAASLIKTLKDWTVIQKLVMPVADFHSKLIFGKGNLEKLKMIIQSNPSITAVFIGIDILKAIQNAELQDYFKVQVFDRYQIILQIFHNHAHTNEAKLQLALAEIPYLRVKLSSFAHTFDSSLFPDIERVGGDGETFMEVRRRILNDREVKIKKQLEKIKTQREFLRRSETRNALPIIAVVGYTNCGKTTLIKSLTNDSRLQPEDKLFATLDVTLHPGFLPSKQKVLYIDTVGFISDVPTALIQSFRSTLEEINIADLVIHIRDISHPDTEDQKETVLKTLQELNLPKKLLESIVEVRNKIDLLQDNIPSEDTDAVHISATEGAGLPTLLETVEQRLFENTGHEVTLIRVPNGGQEYSWLLREAAIRDAIADPKDANFLILETVISSGNLAKFIHNFGDLTVSIESLTE